jgi:carbamoyltransferase
MSAPQIVIGIWDGHDAGVAVVRDGHTILAINEERLSGRKLEVGWPNLALAHVKSSLSTADWDQSHFAVTTSDPAKTLTRLWPGAKERYYRLRRRLAKPTWRDYFTRSAKYRITQWPTGPLWEAWTRFFSARKLNVSKSRVSVVDHHAAHAATAAYWPEWRGSALIVTLDGIGDGFSGSVWRMSEGESGSLELLLRIPGAASLGLFFEHVTEVLQMRPLEDEGKVMALATFAADLVGVQDPFADWFKLTPRQSDGLPLLTCRISPTQMRKAVEWAAWRLPREQLCRAAQGVLEKIVPEFFARLSLATNIRNFGYAGGVASNIKVNRLVRMRPEIDQLAVCPAMGDGGLALGSALWAWHIQNGRRPAPFSDFRLGSDRGNLALGIENILHTNERCEFPSDVAVAAAELITRGEIVMWAQGRMELGPRALGARSIIARADSEAARDALNLKLKRRVWYQPFCPTMLEVEAPRLLADYRDTRDINRHMTMGYMTTALGRQALAGAIGPDASCRPQMVVADAKDPWARMLSEVKVRTGVGAVINTSLNVHGKPMPDLPHDIVLAWRESGIKYLILGSACLCQGDR